MAERKPSWAKATLSSPAFVSGSARNKPGCRRRLLLEALEDRCVPTTITPTTFADGQAVLPGDYTFTSADAGLHTFTGGVTLTTASPQTITVADAGTGSLTGSSTVSVTPAAADHILLTGPTSASAGTPFDLVVTLQDAHGNTVTGYSGTVTFATDDPNGTVPADYTFTAADAGSHTFSDGVTLYADGSRITVTDTMVDTLTSNLVIHLA
jgi:hypothetical protein